MTDPIRDLIAAAKFAHTWMVHFADSAQAKHSPAVRNSIEDCERQLRQALAAAEASPAPTRCRPECTTMATDCDYCRPAPAAEPSDAVDLEVAMDDIGEYLMTLTNHGDGSIWRNAVRNSVRSLRDAVETLAREVRRG